MGGRDTPFQGAPRFGMISGAIGPTDAGAEPLEGHRPTPPRDVGEFHDGAARRSVGSGVRVT